ncbi:M20/M25/M40 family metallo-hydrolase [Calditrichota bacterium]
MISNKIDPRIIDIFKELISIEGLSGNERHVADYIKNFLKKYNLSIKEDNCKIYSQGNSGNLICKIGNGGNTVFVAHMDTARSTKSVNPVISNDRIESSGDTILGADNRAGIAVILYSVEKAIEDNKKIPNITLAFTVCEETSLLGSDNIKLDNINVAYVFDSALRPGNFISQSYGAKSFKIIVNGRASHSGLAPEKGINAIQIAAKAINKLHLGRVNNNTTVNIGKINGGEGINVVPAKTIIEGEVRSLTMDSIETVIQDIEHQFKSVATEIGGEIEVTTRLDFAPYKVSSESEVCKRLTKAIIKVGLKPMPSISAGGSDANSLNRRGIPTINLGIGAQNPHSNNEYILLEDFQKSAEIAAQLINLKKD